MCHFTIQPPHKLVDWHFMVSNYARLVAAVVEKAAFNTFHQKIGLKFKEETSQMLHLVHRIVWC